MFDVIKDQIIESLPVWGYPVIFLGVMLENAGIPVPGETIVLTAGFLSFKGILNPIIVVLSAFAAVVAGVGKMQWKRFFFINVRGAVLWAIVITLVGYYFGHGRETISSYFSRYTIGQRHGLGISSI